MKHKHQFCNINITAYVSIDRQAEKHPDIPFEKLIFDFVAAHLKKLASNKNDLTVQARVANLHHRFGNYTVELAEVTEIHLHLAGYPCPSPANCLKP